MGKAKQRQLATGRAKSKGKSSATRKAKRVTKLPEKPSKKLGKFALANALQTLMKERSGRKDLKFEEASKCATSTMHSVPLSERAGYPLKFPKGSVDPKDWKTGGGHGGIGAEKEIVVDFKRADWLPDEWGQGVKCTNVISRSGSGNGGTYTVLMSPDGKCFYHRKPAEEYWGKPFSMELGRNGQIRKAQLLGKQQVQVVRAQIKNCDFSLGTHVGVDPDDHFFKLLTPQERKCLPSKNAFHFCVVSARRATDTQGIQDIFMVESQFLDAGVKPTWYVDAESLKAYRSLGLTAVVGGPLTEARNKCLADAARMGKACVQASDDISAWEYRHGPRAKAKDFDSLNAACASAERFILSPVAAARFLLAKMRGGAPGEKKPQLGGVYMLGSCSRTFAGDEFKRHHFCIGDFFVVDQSKVRFDPTMTLKEDYDFTASHIQAHGSVFRCERMTLQVKHYSNSGGAVDERAKGRKGEKERMNIAILNRKWPGCFRPNPKRQNEVIFKWKGAAVDADGDDEEGDYDEKGRSASKPTTLAKAMKTVRKTGLKKAVQSPAGLPSAKATLRLTGKAPLAADIAKRCKKVNGMQVGKALGCTVAGRTYKASDLKYDLLRGFLVVAK